MEVLHIYCPAKNSGLLHGAIKLSRVQEDRRADNKFSHTKCCKQHTNFLILVGTQAHEGKGLKVVSNCCRISSN
jgi:hypothetical protein